MTLRRAAFNSLQFSLNPAPEMVERVSSGVIHTASHKYKESPLRAPIPRDFSHGAVWSKTHGHGMFIVKTCGKKYESRATHFLPSEYLLNL